MARRRYRPADSDSVLKAPFLRRMELIPDKVREGEFPFTLPFLARGEFHLDFEQPVTILVGENGTGKSTLLEAIAQHLGFGLQGGSCDNQNHPGDPTSEPGLGKAFRFVWLPRVPNGFFFRAESFLNLVHYLNQTYIDDNRPVPFHERGLHGVSHGEAFLALFGQRLGAWPRAMYLFDEPEAALSPTRQIDFLRLIERGRKTGNVQYIIATHSPILMAYPSAQLPLIDHRVRPRRLADTPHMRLYEDLMRDPRGYIAAALSETEAEGRRNEAETVAAPDRRPRVQTASGAALLTRLERPRHRAAEVAGGAVLAAAAPGRQTHTARGGARGDPGEPAVPAGLHARGVRVGRAPRRGPLLYAAGRSRAELAVAFLLRDACFWQLGRFDEALADCAKVTDECWFRFFAGFISLNRGMIIVAIERARANPSG